jgi:hypothetical protein
MVHMPAKCTNPACGHIFQTRGFNVTGEDVVLQGNVVTCPRCRSAARVADGHFNAVYGGIEMLAGPEWSWSLIQDLGLALRRAVETRSDDPIGEVEKVNPRFAQVLKWLTSGWDKAAILALLTLIYMILTGENADPTINVDVPPPIVNIEGITPEDVQTAVENALRQAAQRDAPPTRGRGRAR